MRGPGVPQNESPVHASKIIQENRPNGRTGAAIASKILAMLQGLA